MKTPFLFEKHLLESCATSNFAAHLTSIDKYSLEDLIQTKNRFECIYNKDESCCVLFEMHQSHFSRSLNDGKRFLRFQIFVDSVVFVFQHNSQKKESRVHQVTLNKFSDTPQSELPLSALSSGGISTIPLTAKQDKLANRVLSNIPSKDHFFVFDDIEYIVEAASAFVNGNLLKKSRGSKGKDTHTTKNRRELHRTKNDTSKNSDGIGKDSNSLIDENLDIYWSSSLNWATKNNPDGVSIVNPPIDQGACGSCWAFAATGTLEANIARQAASTTLLSYLKQRGVKHISMLNETEMKEAIEKVQNAQKSVFEKTNLSVQELLNCDTKQNKGCIGGNPLASFYFINQYGLTSSKECPYVGYQSDCEEDILKKPTATVKSWGYLPPDSEDLMELVVRYIGPIAVGFNGADREFMSYKEGIFSSKTCSKSLNHAMLIVGYGEENGGKYWIARNTWGTDWGENGFVRIKRGNGSRGFEGICGISKIPSVAIGGSLVTYYDLLPESKSSKLSKPFLLDSNRARMYSKNRGSAQIIPQDLTNENFVPRSSIQTILKNRLKQFSPLSCSDNEIFTTCESDNENLCTNEGSRLIPKIDK